MNTETELSTDFTPGAVAEKLPILVVSPRDAARMLSISDTTLRRLVASGAISQVRLFDEPRYRVDEIRNLVDSRTKKNA